MDPRSVQLGRPPCLCCHVSVVLEAPLDAQTWNKGGMYLLLPNAATNVRNLLRLTFTTYYD